MTQGLKVWSEDKRGADGLTCSVRYLLTHEELEHLQRVGLIGEVGQLVGLQDVADSLVAQLEMQAMVMGGGLVQ